jgi:hypothetical protein
MVVIMPIDKAKGSNQRVFSIFFDFHISNTIGETINLTIDVKNSTKPIL